MKKYLICLIPSIILVLVVVIVGAYMKMKDNQNIEGKEIERKWLIKEENIPYNLSKADKYTIEQTYICFSPEIRIRKINGGDMYTLTIKSKLSIDGLVRDEQEWYISEEEYLNLLTKKEGNTIYKTRYQLRDGKEMKAFDIFEGELEGLVYMEIEFKNEKEAKEYENPEWVIKDVTGDNRYKNQSLARYGIPKD